MIIGHHIMWTAYGCWLPNDPRGSCSQLLRVEDLSSLGEIHSGRKKIQPPSSQLRQFYQAADPLLEHKRCLLTNDEFLIVATSFAEAIRDCKYTCYACAIMLDHVHLVMRRHRDKGEAMIENFQEASKQN